MPVKITMFQPGTILHDSISGAFRANGSSFDGWCRENGVNRSTARQYTHGQSQGATGKAMLKQMIEDAGVDLVECSYRARILREAQSLKAGDAVLAAA